MPLYLADIHLHRARLFRDLGYGRRSDELADAEAVAVYWPPTR